ncbi:MAG: DUF2304 domain-containing protein [Acidimicrobiaceae bacterium]|nr:DUF2304 domain-containing protein [Acidimicrobiaceae bacterium]
MSGVHLIALVLAVVTISLLVELLRRRHLRQKYALMWIVVGVAVAVVAIFPGTFNRIARDMGVVNPADLLVVLAALFLLLVCVHLSWEIGRLEDRNRRLAEELTLLRNDVDRLAQKSEADPVRRPSEVSDPGDEGAGRRQPAPRASRTPFGPS